MKLEDAIKQYEVRPAWKVMVGDEQYQCYWIEGLEHDYGKWNNEDPKLWVDFLGELTPYQRSLQRICWSFDIEQKNSAREKWNSTSFDSRILVNMIANGKPVFQFSSRDMNYALARIQVLMIELCEHPYNFLDHESENGRKIWYEGLPAIIKKGFDPGNILVSPDLTKMTLTEWKEEYAKTRLKKETPGTQDYDMEKDSIDEMFYDDNDLWFNHGSALSDDRIDWFRK